MCGYVKYSLVLAIMPIVPTYLPVRKLSDHFYAQWAHYIQLPSPAPKPHIQVLIPTP